MTGICQSCGKKAELHTCSFCGAQVCSECLLDRGCKICKGRLEGKLD
ncbi:MAG: orotate phosphoribosyltransferase [Candidatus Aenigmatarchaeota archaeon]